MKLLLGLLLLGVANISFSQAQLEEVTSGQLIVIDEATGEQINKSVQEIFPESAILAGFASLSETKNGSAAFGVKSPGQFNLNLAEKRALEIDEFIITNENLSKAETTYLTDLKELLIFKKMDALSKLIELETDADKLSLLEEKRSTMVLSLKK